MKNTNIIDYLVFLMLVLIIFSITMSVFNYENKVSNMDRQCWKTGFNRCALWCDLTTLYNGQSNCTYKN